MTNPPSVVRVEATLISIGAAFGIGALLIILSGKDPIAATYAIFEGAFGNPYGLATTLNLAAVLLLTGLAALIAFTAGIWNVGAEGQLYIGGLAAASVAFALQNLGLVTQGLAILAGGAGGALFAAIPAVLKVKLNVNEIVSTLLLNSVALLIVGYFIEGPLRQPGSTFPTTPPIPKDAALSTYFGPTLNSSIVLAVLVNLMIAFLLNRTKLGFEVRIMGGNGRAARYAHIPIVRNALLTMAISGALAGIAGSILLLGTSHVWYGGVSKFYGYLGIGVALLVQLNPYAIVFSAIFFSMLNVGGISMQSTTGVPFELAQVLAAVIVIVSIMRPIFERKARRWQ